MRAPLLAVGCLVGALAAPGGAPAGAWSDATAVTLAEQAGRFAPPDLRRQIERHPFALRRGVLAARRDGAGQPRERAVAAAVEDAVAAIESHEPFEGILERLGAATYWIATANDPLGTDGRRGEPRYAEDFRRYVDSARPRFRVAFYGEGRDVVSASALGALAAAARARSADYAAFVGQEYERIGHGSGLALFDDRSTAFGVAALAYSHAVSDAIATLRYIWLASGGVDRRQLPRLTPP